MKESNNQIIKLQRTHHLILICNQANMNDIVIIGICIYIMRKLANSSER